MKKKLLIFFLGVIGMIQCTALLAQEITVTGVVTDGTTGEPLIGVNIIIQGTTQGSISDTDGNYSITVPSGDAVLVYSYIGYETRMATVGNQSTIDVQLMPSAIGLDELIVIGYGTQRKGSITGSISSVSSEDIQELPISDAGTALQGRAAGVVALSTGNQPGEGVTIRIRGRRSLTATNDPLFVVDGIPYDGNINDINPRDIKSMEVLKDASATAIYGSRGANGVILITTNRGGDFATTVSYSGYYGITSAIGTPELMNGDQYYRLKEVGGRAFTQEEEDAHNAGVSTDWLDLVLDKGHQQSHQLSVRGGSARTGFALSANYFDETGIISIQDYKRYTFRVNMDHKVHERIRVGTSTQVSDAIQNWASNPYGMATNISPLAEPYDANGDMVYRPAADPLLWNPLADFIEGNLEDERTTLRVFSNVFAEVDILKNLEYRLNFGPDLRVYRRGLFQGTNSIDRQGGVPLVKKEHDQYFNYTFENILTYKLEMDNHNLNVTGLYSIQKSRTEKTFIEAENLPYESQLFHNIGTAETVNEFGSELSEWGIMSFMGRVNYEFMGKYMVTLTGRWDGSSRLAEGSKWGFFPSAAAMWRLSSESFLQGVSAISDLRLRVSYGKVGNTGIDPYQTRGSLDRTVYSFGGNAGFGYRPNLLANPDLRWETSTTANLGLDFGFMDNRIAGSFEVYRTHTYDLLLERNLPPTSGFDYVSQNVGETLNRGWELYLITRNIASGDFSWETTLNLFGNHEEILDLYGDKEDDPGNEWFIGEPVTVWYDYEKLGVWQLGEETEAADLGAAPGVIKIKDQNNDGIINQDDKIVIGTDIPKVTVGLGSRFGYKGFDFSFLVLGVFGHTIYNNFEVGKATLQGRYNNLNVDFWTETNPTNDHPKPDGSVEYPRYSSSRAYYPGDFIKIKNLQLGYTLPRDFVSKAKIKNLRVFVNMDTPYIWSRLPDIEKNLDPELYNAQVNKSGEPGYDSAIPDGREVGGRLVDDVPSTRMFSFGVMLDF